MGCCGERKSIIQSVMQAVVAVANGHLVSRELRRERMNICRTCEERDASGTRLYRICMTMPWCGAPALTKLQRDDFVDGCGCQLAAKTRYSGESCPRGRWGVVKS
jgi:hypothetical protein